VAVDDEGPLPDALGAALAGGARAAVVTTRAQNPTGAAVSAQRAVDLRTVLGRHRDVLLIEDDHAAELAGVPLHSLSAVTTAWAFVRSASKPFGPDLRLAVLAGDEVTMGREDGRMRIGTGWVSTVLQRLMLRLWQDDGVAAAVAAAAAAYTRRRAGLVGALSARGLEAHGATGINVWVRVSDETRAVTVMRDSGYAVAPGALFRIAAPPGIRMSIGPLADADIDPLAAAIAAASHPVGIARPSR
jgi:DNA-binding transcriptional MocR family regulator